MARRPVTARVRVAARKNLVKAHISRIRLREPRSLGRALRGKLRGLGRVGRPRQRTGRVRR